MIIDAIKALNGEYILYCGIKYDAVYNKPTLTIRLNNPNVIILIGIVTIFMIGLMNIFNIVMTAAIINAYQKLSIEIPGI